MKIIEALKKIKDLKKKAEDLRDKIGTYCADMDHETPVYGTVDQQRAEISKWLQSHSDILKEISKLHLAIQKTNVGTVVPIELGGKTVQKTIAEWIVRRRELAGLEHKAWQKLGDRSLPATAQIKNTRLEPVEVRIRRYFDPKERDEKTELYRSEPMTIDATLEVVNAVTDLIE